MFQAVDLDYLFHRQYIVTPHNRWFVALLLIISAVESKLLNGEWPNAEVLWPDSVGGSFVYSCKVPAAVERLKKIRVRSLKICRVSRVWLRMWNLYLVCICHFSSLFSLCSDFLQPWNGGWVGDWAICSLWKPQIWLGQQIQSFSQFGVNIVSPRQTLQKLCILFLKSVDYRVTPTIGLHYYIKSQNGH